MKKIPLDLGPLQTNFWIPFRRNTILPELMDGRWFLGLTTHRNVVICCFDPTKASNGYPVEQCFGYGNVTFNLVGFQFLEIPKLKPRLRWWQKVLNWLLY